MYASRSIALSLICFFFALSSCKKEEQIEMSDLSGNWIENTSETYKAELEILADGTMYVSYQDTATNFMDTGLVTITGTTAIQCELSWGTKTGSLFSDPKTLEINNFEEDIFPTTTSFIPN